MDIEYRISYMHLPPRELFVPPGSPVSIALVRREVTLPWQGHPKCAAVEILYRKLAVNSQEAISLQ